MGLSIGGAADFIGSLFASDAGVAAGADVAAGAGAAEAGSLTASDLALTAGADGATAATAATAGSTASEVAAFQGVGGTGGELAAAAGGGAAASGAAGASSGQYLSSAQTALAGVNLAKTLLTPRPNLAGPSAPSPMPQAAQVPSAMTIQSGIGGGGGGSPAVAPTLLTGGGGVDPSGLSLGRNTLLGN